MKYNFTEKNLPANFRSKDIETIKSLIKKSISFTVVGMPGMGISTFLKYLVTKKFAHFIHIDSYDLTKYSKKNFFKLILEQLGNQQNIEELDLALNKIKKKLERLTQKHERLVLVFNRFDQLKDEFDVNFFLNLRTLNEVNKLKIILIFSSNKPLMDWSPKAFERGNLELFSRNIFFRPYTNNELLSLSNLYIPNIKITEELFELSGGHLQLLQLLAKSQRNKNFLQDSFIKLQLQRIYNESANSVQQKQLQKFVFNKYTKKLDEYLFSIGILAKSKRKISLFSPLFEKYIKQSSKKVFTKLEAKLINVLEKKSGCVVLKDDIFETLWPNNPNKQSDWALNALIYRLKKNPTFQNQGYMIQNHKKVGYSLNRV